jgi:Tol biopolymer transport system component
VWIDRQGDIEPLKLPAGRYQYPRIDRSGRQIAYDTDDGKDAGVWIYDLSGTSQPRRFTFGGQNRAPLWYPDGTRVAFQSDRGGDAAIWWQRADGSGPAERLTTPEPGTSHLPASWSPDGKILLFDVTKDNETSLWSLLVSEKRAAPLFSGVHSSRLVSAAAISPDGRWVAYSIRPQQNTLPILFVQPFPPTGSTPNQIAMGGIHPVWSRDGKELFFNTDPTAFAGVSVLSTAPTFTFSNAVNVPKGGADDGGTTAERNNDITPDGRRFLAVVPNAEASNGLAVPRIEVVEHWFEELKARVPMK